MPCQQGSDRSGGFLLFGPTESLCGDSPLSSDVRILLVSHFVGTEGCFFLTRMKEKGNFIEGTTVDLM